MNHRTPILPPEEPPASGWRETLWFIAATAAASLIGGAIAKLEHFLSLPKEAMMTTPPKITATFMPTAGAVMITGLSTGVEHNPKHFETAVQRISAAWANARETI